MFFFVLPFFLVSVAQELVEAFDSLVNDHYGHAVLLHLLAPGSKFLFHPDTLKMLDSIVCTEEGNPCTRYAQTSFQHCVVLFSVIAFLLPVCCLFGILIMHVCVCVRASQQEGA